MAIKPLTVDDVEVIAHAAAVEFLSFIDEPMPPFNTRYPHRLESCLAQPFTTIGGRYVYWTFFERAAALFYMIARSQCFINGNKRMAVMITFAFFFINGKWMNIPPKALYEVALLVSESPRQQKDEVIKMLSVQFKKYEVPPPR